VLGKEYVQKKKPSMVKLQKTSEEHKNIIQHIVIRQECGQTWTRVRVWTSIYCSDNY